jgi:predicted dehydrogenase
LCQIDEHRVSAIPGRHRAVNRLGVGVIGAGPWGSTLARTFARLPGVELRWICELDESRRSQARAAHPGTSVTAAVGDVLADPGVTAAIVAVDAPRHHSVGLRVLSADRHLLVEKPLALSVADAAALCEAATARARVLTVGHLLLHHPAVQRAKQLLDAGALGRPLYFEAARTVTGTRRADSAWWTLAPHDVSLALHLFDAAPVTVSAIGSRGGSGTDVATFATLHFDDGRLAHLHAARFAAARERKFSIVGTQRGLSFDELEPEPTLRLSEPTLDRSAVPIEQSMIGSADPLFAQCLHFISCVARGDTTGGNAAHALAVVRVLEAGARSMAANGAPVEVA